MNVPITLSCPRETDIPSILSILDVCRDSLPQLSQQGLPALLLRNARRGQCADCKRRQEYNRRMCLVSGTTADFPVGSYPRSALAKGLRPHCLMRRSGVCLRAMCLWKRFERTTYAAQPRWHSTASTVFKKQACSMVLLCPWQKLRLCRE